MNPFVYESSLYIASIISSFTMSKSDLALSYGRRKPFPFLKVIFNIWRSPSLFTVGLKPWKSKFLTLLPNAKRNPDRTPSAEIWAFRYLTVLGYSIMAKGAINNVKGTFPQSEKPSFLLRSLTCSQKFWIPIGGAVIARST